MTTTTTATSSSISSYCPLHGDPGACPEHGAECRAAYGRPLERAPRVLTLTHEAIQEAVRSWQERGGIIASLPAEYAPARKMGERHGAYEDLGIYPSDMTEPVPLGTLERRRHPRYEEWTVLAAEFNALFAGSPLSDDDQYALELATLCM